MENLTVRIALCNEVLRHLPFEVQCTAAAEMGYDALEIAPFTLGDEPHALSGSDRSRLRKSLDDAGIAMSGLHMLMQAPTGLSITSDDTGVAKHTQEVGRNLVFLCAELGGRYLVHGSGQQRILRTDRQSEGRCCAMAYFETIAKIAADADVVYCIEALSPDRTNFITFISEAVEIVDKIGAPSLRTMLDCANAAQSEEKSICQLLQQYVPTGHIAHVHANEPHGKRPGSGSLNFAEIFATLNELRYEATIGVEPFVYEPDAIRCATSSIRYLRDCIAGLSSQNFRIGTHSID